MEKLDNAGLIVMLTHHDQTVENARLVFEDSKDSASKCWGMKECPLPPIEMKQLYEEMKQCGKTTFLEIVAYTETEGLKGAELAVECGCDYLMGTVYFDSINAYCKAHGLKYLPFVGKISGRPSVLSGSVEEMIQEAQDYLAKGVFGIDLLAYRYTGDAVSLINSFLTNVNAPVCIAGTVDSYERLSELKHVKPWAFTIGSAFFEHKFSGTICEQVDKVCKFMSDEGK